MEAIYWKQVTTTDTRALALANRHYSRQTPTSKQFCPPGNKIVLLGVQDNALWVTQRPHLSAAHLQTRRDGFQYWSNSYFRNESEHHASAMVQEAVSITLHLWGKDDIPRNGLHTFVDPQKVKPTKRRGVNMWGYCFIKAGFVLYPEMTKTRGLLRFILTRAQLLDMQTVQPIYEQRLLWE